MNITKVIDAIKSNPETSWTESTLGKYIPSAHFGVLRRCMADKKWNEIMNTVIKEKLDSHTVANRFNANIFSVGKLVSMAAQISHLDLVDGIELPKTKVQKAEKKLIKQSYRALNKKKLCYILGVVKNPPALRGASLKAAQQWTVDILKMCGTEYPYLVSLANNYTEIRKEQ